MKRAIWQKVFGIPVGPAVSQPAASAGRKSETSGATPIKPNASGDQLAEPLAPPSSPTAKRGSSTPRQTLASLDHPGFLRLEEVLLVFPVSRAAWYEGVKQGKYPSPVKLGKRSVGYRTADVRQLIESPTSYFHKESSNA